MKNKNLSLFAFLCWIIFAVSSVLMNIARMDLDNQTLTIVFDVLLSTASVFLFLCFANGKKASGKIAFFLIGLVLPNIFTWGVFMLGKEYFFKKAHLSEAIGLGTMFILLGSLTVAFILKCAKQKKKSSDKILALICAGVILGNCIYCMPMLEFNDSDSLYDQNVLAVKELENTYDTAVAQTEMYNIIKNHFISPLPEGKTQKKCIVIGYDGARCDVIKGIYENENGGIKDLLGMNGHAYLSYCGGVNWPVENTQDTSTAPGWCSMLTGQWADVHGIYENNINKSNEHLTLFTTLVEDKIIDSSSFVVSWDGHFVKDDSTYFLEKQYIEENKLNVSFIDTPDDDGTYSETMAEIQRTDAPDFLFCILEHCDHSGHATDFGATQENYVKAFKADEEDAHDMIEKIKERATYDEEDWLIIITSDHGGYGSKHGFASKQERYTFIVTNKEVQF